VNKALSATIALLAAFVLQVSIASHIAIFGVVPNFMFLVVVTIALTQGPVAGGVSGFVGGLLFDLLGSGIVGPYALVLTVVGYVAGMLTANLFAEGWLLPVSVVAVASLATEVAHGIVLVVLGTGLQFWHELIMVMLPSVIYHTALAVIAYPLLARLLRAERPMKSFRHLA
jgi:rod shape-determining protein MreD